MTNIPHSIVDFAAALKLLAESQSDVAEIVTKWDLICNTETPRTVEITLSNGVHKVDNLAKIRNDLIKGLSLDRPKVKDIRFTAYRVNGTIDSTTRTGEAWHDVGEDEYEKNAQGWRSYAQFLSNDLRTVCLPDTTDISVSMPQLERVIYLGWAPDGNAGYATDYTIRITSPSPAYADRISETRQHYTMVTFVNTNPNKNAVHLKIVYNPNDANGYVMRTIPFAYSVTYFVWAALGQNLVNLLEQVPELTGGA